jgi:hypothetical protein
METVEGFEDILELLGRHQVRYLIVGGLAFIFHEKPRYTKGIDLWIDPEHENVQRAHRALADFGSPELLSLDDPGEVLQLPVAPNRIDLLRSAIALLFAEVWPRRIVANYGRASANWVDLDSLLLIKSRIDHPRHREDARVLRQVLERERRR